MEFDENLENDSDDDDDHDDDDYCKKVLLMSFEADINLQESDIEGSYGTNPNEGKKMYNHRY